MSSNRLIQQRLQRTEAGGLLNGTDGSNGDDRIHSVFAAYHDGQWPTEPHLVLWHAATLLREFRGDGHVVALLAEGLDGYEAHVTQVGTGTVPREALQPHRGWSDEEWEAASQRLQQRGLLDESGLLTPTGIALRQAIEDRTDLLALPLWS